MAKGYDGVLRCLGLYDRRGLLYSWHRQGKVESAVLSLISDWLIGPSLEFSASLRGFVRTHSLLYSRPARTASPTLQLLKIWA